MRAPVASRRAAWLGVQGGPASSHEEGLALLEAVDTIGRTFAIERRSPPGRHSTAGENTRIDSGLHFTDDVGTGTRALFRLHDDPACQDHFEINEKTTTTGDVDA